MSDIPECCIRGPDLHDPGVMNQQIGDLSAAALTAYEAGLRDIRRVWNLGQLEQQVARWRQERTFLLGQLRRIERAYPAAVTGALAAGARAETEGADEPTLPAGGGVCES